MSQTARISRTYQVHGQTQTRHLPTDRAETWDASGGSSKETCRLLSLFAPAPTLDAHQFLLDAYGQERFFWSEPSAIGGFTIAGTGIAAEIRIPPILDADGEPSTMPGYRFDEVAGQAHELFLDALFLPAELNRSVTDTRVWLDHPARPRLFGGFAFQDDFVPDNTWSSFSPAQFVLPHFQYTCDGDKSYLTITALVSTHENVEESLKGLRDALLARLATPLAEQLQPIQVTDLRFPMSADQWEDAVQSAVSAIHDGQIEKVVLSRVCEARTDQPIDAAAVLAYLDQHYRDCYRFIFEPVPNHAFFGATPELLIRKRANHIETMALAGSAARSRDQALDNTFAEALLMSDKDRHEHQLVVDSIRAKLESEVEVLSFPDSPVMLKLSNIQHLLTPIEGELVDSQTGILSLVRLLHPTPAMGGVPADRALAFLRRTEPVPRGWYAAPIGWLDTRNEGVFAVAIRSAVTQHNRVWLYAGAGIVGDSEPDKEWAETALKFRPMLDALGVAEAF